MGLSRRAYARHRGVSDMAVRKVIASGRIALEADGTIDPRKADLAWGRHSDPAQARPPARPPRGTPRPVPVAAVEAVRETLRENGEAAPASGGMTFVQARTANEVIKAQERRLRLTGPIVWGEPGTNGQHAFFQLLHQGADIIPVEFLIAAEPQEQGMAEHHALLVANCLAQSQALMRGRTRKEAEAQLLAMGRSRAEARTLSRHREFPGNRPSLTLAYRKLDPKTLGRLIALYEHRVFVEAAIWNINAFDQWGVELGKELATALLPVVEGKASARGLDSSTDGLAAYLRKLS